MELRDKVMRKANLTSCLLAFCLASLAMPLIAQQAPATPDAVRKELNQPAPAKPAAGANPAPANQAPSAGAAAPKQAQPPKPAPPSTSAIKPAATAPKSASGSVPNSPAGSAASNATAKPADNSAAKPGSGVTPVSKAAPGTASSTIKPAAAPSSPAGPATINSIAKPADNSAAKTASGVTPGSKAAPATASNTAKSAAHPGSKISSSAAASSTAKSLKLKSATAAKSNVPRSAATPTLKTVAVRESIVRRDPFSPLLGNQGGGGGPSPNLPPGKPGLLISSLRIDGVVSAPSGMIAIVSNAQDRVYFLREGDRLYDGQVEHITMDGISFHQTGKDPFGNAVEREVAKRLNSTPGEQR